MTTNRTSSYGQYLPAILQADPFLGRFLLAFERVLSGISPPDPDDPFPDQPGLENYLDRIHTYFDPLGDKTGKPEERSPAEFLPWLASWVALSLRDDWEEEVRRRFISQIVPLYRQRGTKAGLKKLLELYTSEEVEIYEFHHLPSFFQVRMTLSTKEFQQKQQIAKIIINQEKPAHTIYVLQIITPTMQIVNEPIPPEEGLIVGRTTILGTSQANVEH
jgi:phage tail-like protein